MGQGTGTGSSGLLRGHGIWLLSCAALCNQEVEQPSASETRTSGLSCNHPPLEQTEGLLSANSLGPGKAILHALSIPGLQATVSEDHREVTPSTSHVASMLSTTEMPLVPEE
jgi:hypothetical protein